MNYLNRLNFFTAKTGQSKQVDIRTGAFLVIFDLFQIELWSFYTIWRFLELAVGKESATVIPAFSLIDNLLKRPRSKQQLRILEQARWTWAYFKSLCAVIAQCVDFWNRYSSSKRTDKSSEPPQCLHCQNGPEPASCFTNWSISGHLRPISNRTVKLLYNLKVSWITLGIRISYRNSCIHADWASAKTANK